MSKVLRKVKSNWFVFFGYFSLFLLTLIAALQIYDANYKITGRYKEIANKDNSKLHVLLMCQQNIDAIESIRFDSALQTQQVGNSEEVHITQLVAKVDDALRQNTQFLESAKEATAFEKLQASWKVSKESILTEVGEAIADKPARSSQIVHQRNYDDLHASLSSLTQALTAQSKMNEFAADKYFQRSIVFINVLIVVRVVILIMIGIIILTVVARLRTKNKALQQTQARLLQNQAHLLASQQIARTGSWELTLTQPMSMNNTLTWSDETYRIFGYQPGEVEVTGEVFLRHVDEEDQARISDAFRESLEKGICFDIEHKIVLRDGSVKHIYERSNIFYDENGMPERMIGTCQDLTNLKVAEQKLSEAEREKHRLKDQINRQKIFRQKEITRATIKAQERERLELGRELHDNVNQILSTSKLFIESAAHNPEKQHEMLGRSKELINTCIEELRKLSRFLAPPSLGDLTLKESIVEIVEEYNKIDGKKTIDYVIADLSEENLSDDLKISVYRIIQEQLNNIRKYAAASDVRIFLKQSYNNIMLHIEDNGCGFEVQAKRKGLGITNIINRAETFNGTVQIMSSPGKGCSMYINFRLNKASVVNIAGLKEKLSSDLFNTGS